MIDTVCRHEWTPAGDAWACAECDATSAACVAHDGPTGSSLLICEACIAKERAVLDVIDRHLEQWDERDRVRGRSPAAFAIVPVHGGGHDRPEGPEDVWGALLGWVVRWTEHCGPSGEGATDYLRARIMWAAHNPDASGWEDYRKAVRRTRASARALVGLAPERLADRCPECRAPVVRDRCDAEGHPYHDGLQDEPRCVGCGATWPNAERFALAVQTRIETLPEAMPDTWVTLDEARRIFPDVPAVTWRVWRFRRRLRDTDGYYRVGDIVGLVDTRTTVSVARPSPATM